jgi:hypothetical protein
MHNLLVYGIENQSKNNMDRIELLLNIVVKNNLIIKIRVIQRIKIKIKIKVIIKIIIKAVVRLIYNHIIIVFKIVRTQVIVKVIIRVFHINQKPKNQQFPHHLHLHLHPQHQPQQHYLTTNL